jgi:hypothetical protein
MVTRMMFGSEMAELKHRCEGGTNNYGGVIKWQMCPALVLSYKAEQKSRESCR